MNHKDTILIVDDDQDHLALIERYASSCGLDYTTAINGADAVNHLKTNHFSIIVTDMVMPLMDGMELLKYSKEHYPDIDVIIMTGFSSQYSYIDVIKAGATDFIAKPFKRDEFVAKINRAFRERHLLAELRESKERAEAGSKAKTTFLCTIGHELRTPMNGILGFSKLLSDSDLPPDTRNYATMVGQSADRLMKLLNQILDFSSIEARNNDIHPSHFQLETIFKELLVSLQPRAEKKGLTFHIKQDDILSKSILFGDQSVLAQILYNITDNAIKFTDSGSIEITTRKVRELSDDSIELQFAIKDTGCGLPPEKQEDIFEPFTQAEDYMTRKKEGAGLGLAICAKLAKMMGGKIWLESQEEKGSTFYFTVAMASA